MLTARYAVVQSSYWSAFCLIVNFASVYLLAHGLSNAQIGMMLAVAGAVATVVQPVAAGFVDRSRLPLRLWIVLGGVVLAALTAALLPQGGGLLVGLTYGLLVASIQVVQPLVNSLGMAAISRGFRVNFGVARASGSLAFALVSVGAGALVAATSAKVLLLLIAAVVAVFIGGAVTFAPRSPIDAQTPGGSPLVRSRSGRRRDGGRGAWPGTAR